ncbi:MAG: hypothetical protein JNK15_04565 [Planctomycetes bacterium]|nr:hypothetical protein [Planctomycetota bacterium]
MAIPRLPFVLLLGALLLSACATRSISDAGFPHTPGNRNALYRGELSDFDVVGRFAAASDAAAGVALPPRAHVLVVQSGALFPDEVMLAELGRHFEVAAASGVPLAEGYGERGMLAAAARGGFDAVVAYWGMLESQQDSDASAWVPVAGLFFSSTTQKMRLRLRVVVGDARTGQWRSLLTVPKSDERRTSLVGSEGSDRDQVELVKREGYGAAAEAVAALVRR